MKKKSKWIFIAPCCVWCAAIGAALGNWLMGIGVGTAAGVGVSFAVDRLHKK